jgi:GR25 family glycosyltransferase involved in LPS biosynthesis
MAFATSVKHSDIPAFCINLNERPERWASVQEQFANLAWPVNRWPGGVADAGLYPRLPRGHCGLIKSCQQLWQHCLSSGLDVVAIFEDDAVFPTDFADIFPKAYAELPDDWVVWHLHSATANGPPVGNYVVKINEFCWGAHGYLINARGLSKVLEIMAAFTEDNVCTSDNILTNCLLSAGLSPYGVTPAHTLCFQSGESSDIPETAALGFWQEFKTKYYR